MMTKKRLKFDLKKAIFGFFFAIMGIFGLNTVLSNPVYAVPEMTEQQVAEQNPEAESPTDQQELEGTKTIKGVSEDVCKQELGEIGWLVCPSTGKIAKATDWLYEKIEDVLVISPISMEDGTPIYEIWKYCRGLTNIVFIIFLLVVIYSQITGLGITNYGVKKALPKLIIATILVNLSFLLCSLAVDVSNIIGNGLRGVFASIAESAVVPIGTATPEGDISYEAKMGYAGMYSTLAGGAALFVGGVAISFETGAIWMLIPMVLGAIVAVASGLITVALRQAVVTLLIMISPLAIVASILPNTEVWFKKWKDLLLKMLIFYPMFSLLFGASNLAGFAIIASAKNGFAVLLGTAVQIFPLFFSWSLMKMSGTFLGTINSKIRGIASKPLATNRAWADSRRQLAKQRTLARQNPVTPSARLMQYMANRKMLRDEETKEYAEEVSARGAAYIANKHYRKNGTPNKDGEKAYERQARMMEYQKDVMRHKNNMTKGLGQLESVKANATEAQKARLNKLDVANVNAADALFMETARGEKIEYDNAIGRYNRIENAMNAHFDAINEGKVYYKSHTLNNGESRSDALGRYNMMRNIMGGNEFDIDYVAANASQAYDTQKKIVESKMQKYFDLTPATQDVVNRLTELTTRSDAANNIDLIISGMRILNQRGDTDKLKNQLDNILDSKQGLILGTHASQAVAGFLQFEVKDNDPFLRRFGKYINLETARVFDERKDKPHEMRKLMRVGYDEYIDGYHIEPNGRQMWAKKSMAKLIEGTSLDNIERTAMSNLDESLKKAYRRADGKVDLDKYIKKREELQTAFEPAFLSSSLKWLSGSEQINSAIKFWTGYGSTLRKDNNGNAILKNGLPVYDLDPVWESDDFDEKDREKVKEYYKRKTRDYFKDQTTGQILGMRTDYREPTIAHLMDMYFDGVDEDKVSKKESDRRRAEYNAAVAEIQTRYKEGYSAEEAQKKREKDITALRRKIAGGYLRKILDGTGKLEQIYTTRRSGAANNAKDWLRQMLNLDDKEAIYRYLDNKNAKRPKDKESNNSQATGDGNAPSNTVYNDPAFRTRVMTELNDIFDKTGDDGDPDVEFYEQSLDKVTHEFGKDSLPVAQYKEFKKNNAQASRSELWDALEEILGNFFADSE